MIITTSNEGFRKLDSEDFADATIIKEHRRAIENGEGIVLDIPDDKEDKVSPC